MNQLKITFTSMADLCAHLASLSDTLGAGTNPEPSLALYTNEELLAELATRSMHEGADPSPEPEPELAPTTSVAAATPTAEPAVDKPKRGRPVKEKKVVAANGAPADTTTPAAPTPKPDKSAASVAPSLPDEDDVMALISQVYSASNDMQLIRTVLNEIGGKTQLSQIPVALWPTLVERLHSELKRLEAA